MASGDKKNRKKMGSEIALRHWHSLFRFPTFISRPTKRQLESRYRFKSDSVGTDSAFGWGGVSESFSHYFTLFQLCFARS